MRLLGVLTRTVTDLAVKNAYLTGLVEGINSEGEEISEKLVKIVKEKEKTKMKTFAKVAALVPKNTVSAITGMTKKVPQLTQVVFIKPPLANKDEKSEESKEKVMSLIDPGSSKLKIKGLRLRKDGRVVIKAATAADIHKKS